MAACDAALLATAIEDLRALITLAGPADADALAWGREALARGTGLLDTAAAGAAGNDSLRRQLAGLRDALALTADQAVLRASATAEQRSARRDALAAIGPRESAWTFSLAGLSGNFSGDFSASASPASPVAGAFAERSATASPAGGASGSRLALSWRREPSPIGPRQAWTWGLSAVMLNASGTAEVVLADADTGAGSLNDRTTGSNLALRSYGLALDVGLAMALDNAGRWSLQTRGFAGLHRATLDYGTRSGVVTGGAADQTTSVSGLGLELGAEVEAAWRFAPRWAATGSLGYELLRCSFGETSTSGTFIGNNGLSQTPGTYSEGFDSLTLSGWLLGIGLRRLF